MKRSGLFFMIAVVGSVCASGNARAAIGLPDSESCNSSSSDCLTITQNGTHFAIAAFGATGAVSGQTTASGGTGVSGVNNFSTGVGVSGVSLGGYGVSGGSTSGAGVHGDSSSNDGVSGQSAGSGASGVYGANIGQGYGVAGRVSPAGLGVAVYGDNNSTTNGAWAGWFHGKLGVSGKAVCSSCSGGLWSTSESDSRLKTNIEPISDGLDRVMRLRAVTFNWKDPDAHGGESGVQRGFIAQEVEKVLPEWVGVNEKGVKTVNYNGIDALLVESVQSLKKENDSLRTRMKALELTRGVAAAGLNGNGLLGLGLIALAGAIVTKRRRPPPRE